MLETMKKYILFSLLFPAVVFAQADTLTLSQCVQIALKHNPQIQMAQGSFEGSEADLKLSRSALLPQITAQAAATKNGGTFVFGPIARPGNFDNYSAGFQAQQLIFDFGKTITKLSASSDLVKASHQDLRGTDEDVILNTNITYFNYLQAVRVRVVDQETVNQAEDHLHQAQAFYKAGTVPQYDVVQGEVVVANANVNLIQAANNVKLARIQLENILGVKLPENFVLRDNLEIPQANIDMKTAIETAVENRPELLSSQARVQASKSLLTSAWTANLPNILATGGYKWNGAEPQPLYSSWNIGVTVSLPIFEGWALDAGIDQAKANLKSAEASKDLVMQSLLLDIQQQEFALQEATQRIEAAKKLVQQANDALRLAIGRYSSGVGSALETTDAQVALSNARITYIQSLYDYRVSYASLERAMGIIK